MDKQRKQQLVRRIRRQRERLKETALLARQSALQDAAAVRVDRNDPLPQRLAAFVRLHPMFSGAVVALVAYGIGPGRLLRSGSHVLPLLLRCVDSIVLRAQK